MSSFTSSATQFSPFSTIDYSGLQALPEIWPIAAHRFGETFALRDEYSKPTVLLTYAQLHQSLQQFAQGLQALGLNAGDRLALFADNSGRWFIADQGCMTAGVVDAVRSSEADPAELAYIYENSESSALLVEDLKTCQKVLPLLSSTKVKFIGLLSDEPPLADSAIPMMNFNQILEAGANHLFQAPQFERAQLATLLYTSGTGGQPKGVLLSHGNFMHQMTTFTAILQPYPGTKALSILPTWHSFGRTVTYYLLSQGCTQIYTNIRQLKRDLLTHKPEFMASVPRLWESLYEAVQKQFRDQPQKKQKLVQFFFTWSQRYIEARRIVQKLDLNNLNPSLIQTLTAQIQCWLLAPVHAVGDRLVYTKVREALGGNFKASVSGGGSLPMYLENFFEIVGITLLVGYGLTETSPVLTVRRVARNLRRSAGQPLAQTQLRIVTPDTRTVLPLGQKGLVLAAGPQIMQGYCNNPEATAKAIDPEGWFDTGDLGWLTAQSDLILTGRAKDTIVLLNGENIEPQPIEDACVRSPYIDQIVLVGQDQRSLGALIVPNQDTLLAWVKTACNQSILDQYPDPTILANALRQWIATPDSSGLKVASNDGQVQIVLEAKAILDLYRQELVREVKDRPGYRPDDRIGPFELILEPFSMENGLLTQTMKVRRPVVMERYRDMINRMFS